MFTEQTRHEGGRLIYLTGFYTAGGFFGGGVGVEIIAGLFQDPF